MADALDQEIALLTRAASDARICACSEVAALAWLVYDTVLSIARERKYMWRAKSSIPKVLYLTLRYFTPLDLIITVAVDTNYHVKYNGSLCHAILWYKALISLYVPSILAEALMMIRIYALYDRQRKVLIALCVLFALRALFPIWAATEETSTVKTVVYDYELPMAGCTYLNGPKQTYNNVISSCFSMAISVILLGLTLYKFMQNVMTERREVSLQRMREVRRMSPLMHLFMRDGSMYFALVTLCEIVFLTFMVRFNGRGLQVAAYPWIAAVYSFAGTRTLLNMRSTALRDYARGSSSAGTELVTRPTENLSTLMFALPSTVGTAMGTADASLATWVPSDGLGARSLAYGEGDAGSGTCADGLSVCGDGKRGGEGMTDVAEVSECDDPSLVFASRSDAEVQAHASSAQSPSLDNTHIG